MTRDLSGSFGDCGECLGEAVYRHRTYTHLHATHDAFNIMGEPKCSQDLVYNSSVHVWLNLS